MWGAAREEGCPAAKPLHFPQAAQFSVSTSRDLKHKMKRVFSQNMCYYMSVRVAKEDNRRLYVLYLQIESARAPRRGPANARVRTGPDPTRHRRACGRSYHPMCRPHASPAAPRAGMAAQPAGLVPMSPTPRREDTQQSRSFAREVIAGTCAQGARHCQ